VSIELFQCDRLPGHPKLTRRSCGKRWRNANGPEQSHAIDRPCIACAIGQAHANGEQPDVKLASLTRASTPTPRRAKPEVPGVNAPRKEDDGDMGQIATCRGCGAEFERERGPQKYCRTCRPAKPKGHSSGKRKRSKRSAGETPLQVAETIVEQLAQLSEAEQRRTLDLVHVALGHGTVQLEDDAA